MSTLKGYELMTEIKTLFKELVATDKAFLANSIVYSVAIALLTLAVPVSVQTLINSVAYTASHTMVITLAGVLFILLVASGFLSALQVYGMELFERRFYARLTADFTLKNLYADHQYSENINRYELVNRYFDIMNVKKIIPNLFINGFAIILQMLVGVILVSFYHPWLFVFCVGFLFTLYMIWKIWGYSATEAAVDLSDAKYAMARQLEDIARANGFFKSATRIDFAIEKINHLTIDYLEKRKRYFKSTFAQKISLVLLYAVASTGLLGLGGILVINNQLTLGQLVASELVLSAVFYSVSKLGYYLDEFYNLAAALEEVSRVYRIPTENLSATGQLESRPLPMSFVDANFDFQGRRVNLDFTIEAGTKILASCSGRHIEEVIFQAAKHYISPIKGKVLLGEMSIDDCDPHHLRDKVIVLDRPTVIEATIMEYLTTSAPEATSQEIANVLKMFELEHLQDEMPEKLQTRMSVHGDPLTESETLRLKLAAAWLSKPHILIINEFFDIIAYQRRQRIFKRIAEDNEISVIYFSNRFDLSFFKEYLFIDSNEQKWLKDIEQLRGYEQKKYGGKK